MWASAFDLLRRGIGIRSVTQQFDPRNSGSAAIGFPQRDRPGEFEDIRSRLQAYLDCQPVIHDRRGRVNQRYQVGVHPYPRPCRKWVESHQLLRWNLALYQLNQRLAQEICLRDSIFVGVPQQSLWISQQCEYISLFLFSPRAIRVPLLQQGTVCQRVISR